MLVEDIESYKIQNFELAFEYEELESLLEELKQKYQHHF